MAQESAAKSRDGAPSWDGAADSFQSYCEAALLYEQTTPYHKRYLVGPKLQSELQGAARRLIVGQAPDWISYNGGVQVLLDHLRRCLGKPQVPELTELLSRYFKNSRRKPGECMGDYITRKCELYVRAQQSMHRLRPHHDSVPVPTGDPWDSWGRSGRRLSQDSNMTSDWGTEAEDNQSAQASEATTPAAPTGAAAADQNQPGNAEPEWQWGGWHSGWQSRNWGWQGSYTRSWDWHSSAYQTPKTGVLPQLVPEFVQAWMLLQDAGLDPQEKNTVMIATQGQMTLQRVAQELRNQFSDIDLKKRDGTKRHQGFMGDHYGDGDSEDEAAPEASFIAEDELNTEGLALWAEAEEEVQGALAVLHQARRTLRGARDRQRQVKQSRQYFRSGPPANKASNSGTEKISCLKCGSVGHRTYQCTAPAKPKENRTEMAPFICFADEGCSELALHAQQKMSPRPITTSEAVMMGKGVVDCGATKSLGSVLALERIMALSKNGVSEVDVDNRPTFGFGNSTEDQCVSTLNLRLSAGGRPGLLRIHALDRGTAPVLVSVDALRSLKAIIDFSDDSIVLRGIDATKVMVLERSSTGHLLLPLTGDILEGAVSTHRPVPGLREYVQQLDGHLPSGDVSGSVKELVLEASTGHGDFEACPE
ncbi:unnamed protein product [Symbiodinium sp. CCMP2592]|nr:unnamed protein product [Symbiodinium sp. CCMP2592]